MRGAKLSTLLPLLLSVPTFSAETKKELQPCSAYNPSNGNFYDLSGISVKPLKDHKKAHKHDRIESWHATGYDYHSNFTLNICSPVIESLDDVAGVPEDLVRNVSAYYTVGSKTYSIGQSNYEPIFRGRKLVLNYTNGSPCDSSRSTYTRRKLTDDDDDDESDKKHTSTSTNSATATATSTSVPSHDDSDEPEDDDDSDSYRRPSSSKRTKSTIISFLCDRDALSPLHINFIATSPDECTYFFEARSPSACAGAAASVPQQSLSAGGVFMVIALIAIAVYLLGGIAYQRTVMHQRGWRQLPNYALWAGMLGFVADMGIILCGSCARLIPGIGGRRRGGYDRLNGGGSGGGGGGGMFGRGRGRGGRTQEENGLIDSLDEEWND